MVKYVYTISFILSLAFLAGCGSIGSGSYSLYNKPKTGCISGNCTNGKGTYRWSNGHRYAGNFKNSIRHGDGIYYFPNGVKRKGRWNNGKKDGVFKYYYAKGGTSTEYWDNGTDITRKVKKCREAKTLTNAYRGFVGLVNAFVAGAKGGNVAEGAAWGWNAAGKQSIPSAVRLYCK